MKKTGLEIVEMIAKGKAPKKIKRNDGKIYVWEKNFKEYDLEGNENISFCLLGCLNEKFEIIEENKVWKPKLGEGYWNIDEFGDASYRYWDNDSYDNASYELGNCFKSKEEAQKALEKIKIYVRLKRYALEHNKEKIDWNNRQQVKWYIIYDYKIQEFMIYRTCDTKNIGQVYFTSEKLAEQAIQEIGEDNIKKLFEEK